MNAHAADPLLDPHSPVVHTAVGERSVSRSRSWRALAVMLALSLLLHLAAGLSPASFSPSEPVSIPLTAELKTMPAPPPLVASPKPKPKVAKPKRRPTPRPQPVAPTEPIAPLAEPAQDTLSQPLGLPEPTAPPPPAVATDTDAATASAAPAPTLPEKQLPPRIDLTYKAMWGTQGFVIGEATYRLEHSDNQYNIRTVGEATGLAALFLRGQGKATSRGLITAAGLQPQEFTVERGSPDKREVAILDWDAGIVNLYDNKTAILELPTFDPLTFIWQFYFAPPKGDNASFYVATTRRVYRYLFNHMGDETVTTPLGDIEAEKWHRRNDDGTSDSFVWLAPSMHYVVIKLRVINKGRTAEALLDSIHADEEGDEAVGK